MFGLHFFANLAMLASNIQKYHLESVLGSGFGASDGVACGRSYDSTNASDTVLGQYMRRFLSVVC